MVCDGNVSTFRWVKNRCGVDDFVIDVPYSWSPEGEEYVVGQLRELIALLEKKTGRRYDEDALRETLRRENRSKAYYLDFLEKRLTHAYPNTLTLVLFLLLATHLYIGSEWT
jgi:benzoyl-CoA reductase/2-hydroxyglutaryl-CoA dehydratase subunit BcrC/BadD/HgdB